MCNRLHHLALHVFWAGWYWLFQVKLRKFLILAMYAIFQPIDFIYLLFCFVEIEGVDLQMDFLLLQRAT